MNYSVSLENARRRGYKQTSYNRRRSDDVTSIFDRVNLNHGLVLGKISRINAYPAKAWCPERHPHAVSSAIYEELR